MSKYLAVALAAFRRRMTSVSEFAGRAGLYFIILGVWWKIWSATSFGGFQGFSPAEALWYLAGTEWIVLSIPYVYIDIEADVRGGDLGYSLLRPGNYASYQLASALGLAAANWLVLGGVGFACAWGLTGTVPAALVPRLPAVALLTLASLVACCVVMVILGLVAVWTSDASPCAWLWQKLLFVAGGLMLPLSVYPVWLQEAAVWTPFPYLLGDIARSYIDGAMDFAPWRLAGGLVGWAAVFLAGLAMTNHFAVRKILEDA